MGQFLYLSGKRKLGPVSDQQLLGLAQAGTITPETPITRDGKKWWKAQAFPELWNRPAPEPPASDEVAAAFVDNAQTQPPPPSAAPWVEADEEASFVETPLTRPPRPQRPQAPSHQALRWLAMWYRIIGGLNAAACVMVAIAATWLGSSPISIAGAVVACFLLAVLNVLVYFAISEAIHLAIEIEGNTRRSADAIEDLIEMQQNNSGGG